jgi:hypothetical protein
VTPLGAIALPTGRLAVVDDSLGAEPLVIVGEPGLWRVEAASGENENEGRWAVLRVVPPSTASATTGRIACRSGRLLFVDPDGLEAYFGEASVDGLGDCLFRGRDAREAARTLGAPQLEGRLFGWLDEPAAEARRLFKRVVYERDERGLSLTVEERPHSHRFRALEALTESALAVAVVELPGRPGLLVSTTWGACEVQVEGTGEGAGDGDGVRIVFASSGAA